ncbi:MAG: hypothetical protein ABJI96_10325 [Paracoccaceae bacterium]
MGPASPDLPPTAKVETKWGSEKRTYVLTEPLRDAVDLEILMHNTIDAGMNNIVRWALSEEDQAHLSCELAQMFMQEVRTRRCLDTIH